MQWVVIRLFVSYSLKHLGKQFLLLLLNKINQINNIRSERKKMSDFSFEKYKLLAEDLTYNFEHFLQVTSEQLYFALLYLPHTLILFGLGAFVLRVKKVHELPPILNYEWQLK